MSGEVTSLIGRTAIGSTTSGATNANFEADGQAWLELDTTGRSVIGANTGIVRWTFHTDGLAGASLTGTYTLSATGYDPVTHVAAASVNGAVVAAVPYEADTISYAGVEGSLAANVNDFTIRAGSVTDPALSAP